MVGRLMSLEGTSGQCLLVPPPFSFLFFWPAVFPFWRFQYLILAWGNFTGWIQRGAQRAFHRYIQLSKADMSGLDIASTHVGIYLHQVQSFVWIRARRWHCTAVHAHFQTLRIPVYFWGQVVPSSVRRHPPTVNNPRPCPDIAGSLVPCMLWVLTASSSRPSPFTYVRLCEVGRRRRIIK